MSGSHLDGNSLNNELNNLEWATLKDNIALQIFHGTRLKGELISSHKLDELDVELLRSFYATFKISYRSLAKIFELASKTTVEKIIRRQKWAHIS